MRQDPFDQMRRKNPVPPDQTPAAPMSLAERIIGSGRAMPGWAVAAGAAAAVVVIGGVSLLLVNRPSSTVLADTSTSLAPVASTTGTLPTTTTATHPTTTLGTGDEFTAIIYLFAAGVEDTAGLGPYLIPVARGMADNDVAAGTMLALLEGAPADTPALSSAIPEGVELQSVDVVDGGIAEVVFTDRNAFFAVAETNPGEMRRRIFQVVFSLTAVDGIDAVRFGRQADFPAALLVVYTRPESDELIPAIMIETPAYGGSTASPLVATGTANVFEASVSLALTDGDGLIIWEGFTTATCGTGCRGDWSVEIPFEVDVPQLGSLIAWEESARDGSQINIREHPVWLVPDEFVVSTTTTSIADSVLCSGSLVTDDLVDQPGLPEAVAATRAAIFDAAVACDWSQLGRLVDHDPIQSFGEVGPASVFRWQESEGRGDEPMRYLAGLLNRPMLERIAEEGRYFSWPSAFGADWSEVPEADREALRPLYGEDDFAVFDDFGGYIGYRIGILDDGTWWFFVAGD